METRLRVALVRTGLAAPEVQYRIVDEYGFTLARVDLAYPAAKLAIEYDGSAHFDRRRAERDRQRDAELAGHGWQTVRLVADDLAGLPQTVRRVRLLLRSRRWVGGGRR
jgi:very-short-patch-repair endonuclease